MASAKPQSDSGIFVRDRAGAVVRAGEADEAFGVGGLGARGPTSISRSTPSESELVDVPAAVVCANCGRPDCVDGCRGTDRRSGTFAIVPWERGGGLFERLWSTTRATTLTADAFFEILPDGPLLPALRFALLAELLAVGSMAVPFALALAAIAPRFMWTLATDPEARHFLLAGSLVAFPGLAGVLVLAHVIHAIAIDWGAKRVGGFGPLRRAVRFGLYAAGWDLAMGPFGFFATLFGKGLAAAVALPRELSRLPSRSTRAFLRGAYHLDEPAEARALRTSYVGAVVATFVAVGLLLGFAVSAMPG